MRRWLIRACLWLLWLPGSPARAQELSASAVGIVAERFHPAATSGGYLVSERPETAGPWRWGGGLLASYAHSPLHLVVGPFSQPLLHHLVSAEAMASLGLGRFAEVGLSLPVSLYQDGPNLAAPMAVGDVKLHCKGRLWTSMHLGLGLLGTLGLPSGDTASYASTGQVSFAPRFLLEGRWRWLRAGLNVGVLLRQPGQAGDRTVSHELIWSASIGLRPHHRVEVLGDLFGSTELAAPWQDRGRSPTEAVAGVALHLGPFVLQVGGGTGIVNGYGAPAGRAFVSLRYQQLALSRLQPQLASAAPPLRPPAPPPVEVAAPEVAVTPTTTYEASVDIVITPSEVIPRKPIFFELNRARVRSEFYPVLDALAKLLQQRPELGKIRIEGHTDATGTPAFNHQLSLRRAESVRRALMARGVAPERLIVVGYGPDRPVVSNHLPARRWRNRRVVFYHDAGGKLTATRSGPM
ncbi:MAG: OmpA family protein [Myxococcota bacterium]|nr:OmpA family protein [Myxococcota bacterium]